MSREHPDIIDSVEKAFRLIQAFGPEDPELTISRAAALTGLTRPTARRLLLTLTQLGFAATDGKRYWLTPHILRLGYAYLSSTPVWDSALPHMREVADEVQESVSAAVLDGPEIVYVARVPAPRSMTITLTVGSRLPAYATSMGRVLLADLPDDEIDDHLGTEPLAALTPHTITDREQLLAELRRVRRQGWATVDGEREVGIRSVAAPVRDATGKTIMALNISANAARVPMRHVKKEFVPLLVATAKKISAEVAYATRG